MSGKTSDTGKSRAEQVRQRRNQRSQERVQRAATQVRYNAEAPTVFVRGGFAGPAAKPANGTRRGTREKESPYSTPVFQRTQTRVRRQVSIPLGNSGAEVLMPAMPIIRPGWRLLSAFLVLVLGAMLIGAVSLPQYQVSAPEIVGMERIQVADIEAVLALEGTPIFLVDTTTMKQELEEAFPELMDVQISVRLPNQVKIEAVERIPVLAWEFEGQTIWVDEEGAIFPARGELQTPILHVSSQNHPPLAPLQVTDVTATPQADGKLVEEDVSGFSLFQRRMDAHTREELLSMTTQIPEGTQLVYSETDGYGWSEGAWQVYVGHDLSNMDLKMAMYRRIVERLTQDGITPRIISVANIHAPFIQ